MENGFYWVTSKDRYLPVIFRKSSTNNILDTISARVCGKYIGPDTFHYGYFADFHQGYYSRDIFSLDEFLAEFIVISKIEEPPDQPPAGSP